MKVWMDKSGKKITAKEFMTRWKEGIQNITPLQQTRSQLQGMFVIMIGLLSGILIALINGQWWLSIILVGGFIVNKAQMVGIYQKKLILERLE